MSLSKRARWSLAALWICFLLRGWFYAAMLPLWEGYDEFAHFGVIRAMVAKRVILVPRDQMGSRDVEESLALVPVPWGVRDWRAFRTSLTEEDFWRLSPEARRQREELLRTMPPEWRTETATRVSAYESQHPPLYYWLMTPVLYVLANSSLLIQTVVLRWIAVLIASLAIPLVARIALTVIPDEFVAVGCSAIVAVMPGFATNVARISNEPVAILLFTLLIWFGLRTLTREAIRSDAIVLGTVLGLGLLTKAYFLTAIPAVLALLLYRYRRAWRAGLWAPLIAMAVAGWWYLRNLLTIGTISGLSDAVALKAANTPGFLESVHRIAWRHAVDVILTSHLYFCGWSGLTVRSWIYHIFFAIAILAALGLCLRLREKTVAWLGCVYGCFWIGQLYHVTLLYRTIGFTGSMGWYLYGVVASEVVLCTAAFARYRRFIVALGAILFAALDLFGMHWRAIPYYTGIIEHQPNGALAALHLSQYRAIGLGAVFERLAVNKWALLSPEVLIALWLLYLAATVLPPAAVLRGLFRSKA